MIEETLWGDLNIEHEAEKRNRGHEPLTSDSLSPSPSS